MTRPEAPALAIGWGGGAVLAAIIALAAALIPWRLLSELIGRPQRRRMAAIAAGSTAIAWAIYGLTLPGPGPAAASLLAGAGATLACMAYVDAGWMVIPDAHVLILAGAALARPLHASWLEVASGAVVGGALLLAVRWLFVKLRGVEALGLGDVKLMAAIGALLGPRLELWVVVLASLAGVVLGLARSRGRIREAAPLPFGALAAAPAVGAMLWSALWGPG